MGTKRGWVDFETSSITPCDKELAMPGDDRCPDTAGGDYDVGREIDYKDLSYFKNRPAITSDDVEQLIKSFDQDPTADRSGGSHRTARTQLEVLKPNSERLQQDATDSAEWRSLAQHSAAPESYDAGIAARLEFIACVAGPEINDGNLSLNYAPYIARGLLKARRFDAAGSRKAHVIETLKTAMKSGRKLDGSPCPGALGLDEEDFQE